MKKTKNPVSTGMNLPPGFSCRDFVNVKSIIKNKSGYLIELEHDETITNHEMEKSDSVNFSRTLLLSYTVEWRRAKCKTKMMVFNCDGQDWLVA